MNPSLAIPEGGLDVLVVDEDPGVRTACCEIATRRGHLAQGVATSAEARTVLDHASIDLLLLDLKGPVGDHLALLKGVKAMHPDTAIVVMSAFATVPTAVEVMRTGAVDLLTKPLAGTLPKGPLLPP